MRVNEMDLMGLYVDVIRKRLVCLMSVMTSG